MLRSGFLLLALAVFAGAQEIIVDNGDSASFTVLAGTWISSTTAPGYYGDNYLYAITTASGGAPGEVEWRPDLPATGQYEVYVRYTVGANRADNAPITVNHRDGSVTVAVNQQANGSQWVLLGTFPFDAGTAGYVRLSNDANPTVVIADAVRFLDLSQVQTIAPTDPRIQLEGAFFAAPDVGGFLLRRFSEEILNSTPGTFSADVARTASGIGLRVRTDGSWIRATFAQTEGYWRAGTLAVYQDGVPDAIGSALDVYAASSNPGEPVTFRILCPPYESLVFTGLLLEAGASVYALPPDGRPRYLAVGDSITHGSGMMRTDQTYPWLLAEAKGWQCFNLGVGGSRTTPSFGSMLNDEPLDVVTVLWGQNDFTAYNDVPLFISRYEEFLTNLRQFHAATPVYCLTLTASTQPETGSNGYTREQYRWAVRDIVAGRRAAGDVNIQVIEGLEISTTADLLDTVHLSATGNANVATCLAAIIHYPCGRCGFFDFDHDGDVDLTDFGVFGACFNGPNRPPVYASCHITDFDADSDVDLTDFAEFATCFNGPNRAARCR
ncbi:MAG: hypothetical protein JXA69_15950 [Phycisphaerae bacterium]|nr:hypothetical protein [Phycisphaerae bacterium]